MKGELVMPPKNEEIEVKIPDVKIPEVAINIKSDVKKQQLGSMVKYAVLKELPNKNMYQRLNNARTILNYESGGFLGYKKISGPRGEITKVVEDSLKLLDQFYSGDNKENVVLMDGEKFNAGATNIRAVFTVINKKLDKAIAAYEDHLKKEDDKYPKSGDYLNSAPSDKYIYRYIALDELKAISKICKASSKDNSIDLIENGFKNKTIEKASMEDIFTGREKAILDASKRQLSTTGISGSIDKITFVKESFKRYAEIGNKAATDIYKKIKDIDLTPYAMEKDGKAPILKSEDIRKILAAKNILKDCVKEFNDKLKETDENTINEKLIPEAADIDGNYSKNANNYKNTLLSNVEDLDLIANEIETGIQKIQAHPEMYTLPIALKGEGTDRFLGDTSLQKLIDLIAEAKNTIGKDNAEKNIDVTKAAEATLEVRIAINKFVHLVNKLYDAGPDGIYTPNTEAFLEDFNKGIIKLEQEIQAKEKIIVDNVTPSKKNDVEKYLNSMKKVLNSYKSGVEKTQKEYAATAEGSFERQNIFLVANIHPNADIRKTIQDYRKNRINAAYDEAERTANSKFDSKNMDAQEILNARIDMIKKGRHFSIEENVKACESFFTKYDEMMNQINELYARDQDGGFTHYATDEERAKLQKTFEEVRAEIKQVISKKKINDTTKNLLTSVESEIQAFENSIQGAEIHGTYPIADFLDAGKFGYPSLQETRLAAYGLDRYDLNKYKEKNDQEWVSYDYYKNPIQKINRDIAKLQQASANPKFAQYYSEDEKQWLAKVNDFVKANFNEEFLGKYFTEVDTFDERLGVNVSHFPLMTKADQDQLREKFHGLNTILQEIGASESFKNTHNRTVKAFLNGLATYTQQTEHRLITFHSDLDMPIYTIQEATSGRADTSRYNYRNEPEIFARINNKFKKDPVAESKYIEKLQKAGLILKDEDKYEPVTDPNAPKVRKKVMEKQGYFSKIYTKIFNRNYQASWEYARDINDFYEILEKVKNFENTYLANFENGEYQDLPITHADVPAEGFDGPIKTYEQLKWCYTQIQFQAMVLKDKVEAYNKDNGKDPLPSTLIGALEQAHNKGLVLQTIIALEDAHRTKGDSMNVVELIHSDPMKRKNLWTIRQYKIFHNNRQEKGQLGTYRNLKHFETEYNSEMTYNGRFYDKVNNPLTGNELEAHLEEIKEKYYEGVSEEAKAFADKLLEAVAKDPNKASAFIPTTDEFNAENADYKAILDATSKNLNINEIDWQNEKDREMIKNVITDLGFIGIDKYDHKERTIRGAKYGENLIDHFHLLSKMSEELGFDHDDLPPYQRLVPKTHEVNLTVPGENPPKTYTGMMVEASPDKVGHLDGYDRLRNKEQKVAVNVISGKDLKASTDPDLVSIDGFNNNPQFLKQLASLQTLCFLCNAPMPKFDDLKFAIVPNKEGIKEVQLMSYMPDPAFMETDDFEGKVNLEDMAVIPEEIGRKIQNILAGNKKKDAVQSALLAFAENITDNLVTGEAKERINKVIMKKAEEMSKALNDKTITKVGSVMDDNRGEFYNGIRDKKLLITDDFSHLTIDKLALKPSIFEHNKEGRTNIFTEFSNLPEKVYKNISEEPGMNDENPKMKKAYVDRFVNGVKREAQRHNLEATLADMTDMHDEYFVHKHIQKNSQEFNEMLDALKAIHTLETTGVIKYKLNGVEKTVNIYNTSENGLTGVKQIGARDLDKIKNLYNTASEKVNKYIDAKTGKIFNPLSDLGSRRYAAAKEMQEKLKVTITNLNKLAARKPVKEITDGIKVNPKEKINANALAVEENVAGGRKNSKVKDSKAKDNKVKDSKNTNKKEDQKEKDKGKGGKNK